MRAQLTEDLDVDDLDAGDLSGGSERVTLASIVATVAEQVGRSLLCAHVRYEVMFTTLMT